MRYLKFFKETNCLESIRKAKNIRGAWTKTFEKWSFLVKNPNVSKSSFGADTCGLCDLFLNKDAIFCLRCPVRKKTGQRHCFFTPFATFENNPTKKNAQKELAFLLKVKEEFDG